MDSTLERIYSMSPEEAQDVKTQDHALMAETHTKGMTSASLDSCIFL